METLNKMETLNSVYTPYIGANGNWYVESEDTGVKAQGPAGPQGPTGPGGPQGLIGPKGETGDRGPQGIQGPIGATGAQGIKGDKGDMGPQGPKGDKGDTPPLTADLKAEVPGTALDATMGKVLNDSIAALSSDFTKSFDSLTLNESYSDLFEPSGNLYGKYTKRAGIVCVSIFTDVAFKVTGYNETGISLPKGYCPPFAIYAYYFASGSMSNALIRTDGTILFSGDANTTKRTIFNIIFAAA